MKLHHATFNCLRASRFLVVFALVLGLLLIFWLKQRRPVLIYEISGESGAFHRKADLPSAERLLISQLAGIISSNPGYMLFEVRLHDINHYYLEHDSSNKVMVYTLRERLDQEQPPKLKRTYQDVTFEKITQAVTKKSTLEVFE